MSRDLDNLEAALEASRARLAAARARAEAAGRRPLRRLVSVARILRGGSPFPPAADGPAGDAAAERWRMHALDLEAEAEQLRSQAAGAREAAAEAARALRKSREHAKRLAGVVARLDAERQNAAVAPAVDDPCTTTDYARWIAATQPSPESIRVCRDMGAARTAGPLFSVLVPVFIVPLDVLRATVESVRRQTYPRWELCIVHANPDDTRARRYLRGLAASDPRIKLREMENGGIARNSNAALELATGDYVVLLDHDDVMVDHALSAFSALLCERPEIDFIYSDKDMTDPAGDARINPLFKPQWSPETMLTVNYVTHLNALRTSVVRAIGGWRPETDGAQDWDLFLRFTEQAPNVAAVRDVLYRWRMIETSVAGGGAAAKPYALAAQIRTLEDALRRRGDRGDVRVRRGRAHAASRWPIAIERVTVVVLPREDAGALALAEAIGNAAPTCARSCSRRANATSRRRAHPALAGRSRHQPGRPRESRARGIRERVHRDRRRRDAAARFTDAGSRTWSGRCCCRAWPSSRGKCSTSHGDCIVRTGIVFSTDGGAADLFAGEHANAYGFIGSAHWMRNVSAVAGGMFAVDTAVAREIAFDANGEYPRADVDFCLRVGRAGHRIVYTPFVTAARRRRPCSRLRAATARRAQPHRRDVARRRPALPPGARFRMAPAASGLNRGRAAGTARLRRRSAGADARSRRAAAH